MTLREAISKIRAEAGLSQERFAEQFGVSRQSVQKWESGASTPDLPKLVEIAKKFNVSLDAMILNRDSRMVETLNENRSVKPKYENLATWEFYGADLMTEYVQSVEEGLDIEEYKPLFEAAARLPKNEIQKDLGDILYKIVANAKQKDGYPYREPSTLDEIRALRKGKKPLAGVKKETLRKKIEGAWQGRICGCMLGKSVECIRTNELIPFLKETGNYPMHRYIRRTDITDEICKKYTFPFAKRMYADEIDGMPVDDDTNYVVLAQVIVGECGRDFTPKNVADAWLNRQSKNMYCTAERVAYRNFIAGYEPPFSAIYKNPYREWIGAQIRGDYFGYINPGDPETAAEMAWRDASISHVKNGIYGEMFAAAMIATAAVTDDMTGIVEGGLAEIPYTSRLYEKVAGVLEGYHSGLPREECFARIHAAYDEYTAHGWCHTISNAMIVAASLLYGGGDFGKSVCMAVETGFDTDCNGATVGSVVGMAKGIDEISEEWKAPMHDTLHTSIFGVGTVKISDRVTMTMKHIGKI